MNRIALILVLFFSMNAFALECELLELHPSITITEEGASMAVLIECDGFAAANEEVRVISPSGGEEVLKTNEFGEISLDSTEEGQFLFEVVNNGSPTETEIVYDTGLELSIERRGNQYIICANKPVPIIIIKDGDNSRGLTPDESNCVEYTSVSDSFDVEIWKEGDAEPSDEVVAERKLSIDAPKEVALGKSFFVTVFDNSMPARDVNVFFGSEIQKTNVEGIALLTPVTAGEFEIRAETYFVEPAVVSITVLEEPRELEVEVPTAGKAGEVIGIRATSNSEPVANATIKFGETEKQTNADGYAFFTLPKTGVPVVSVKAEGFADFFSTIEVIEVAELRPMEISVQEQAFSDYTVPVVVKSVSVPIEGARVRIGEEEKFTNESGIAEFKLEAGQHGIVAEMKGFETAKASVEIVDKSNGAEIEPEQDWTWIIAALAVAILVLVIGLIALKFKKRREML